MPFLDTDLVIDPALLSLEDNPAEAIANGGGADVNNTDDDEGSVGRSAAGDDVEDSDEDGSLSSGPESAYEEDEDLDRPVAKKRERPRKDPTAAKWTAKEKGKGKEKARKGKAKAGAAEEEDDVFDRLVGYVGRVPRGGSVIPDGGVLNLGGEEDTGEGGKKSRKKATRPRGGRAAHKPTHEVSLLLSQSNIDYIQGNSQKAIEGFLEVIRLDPYIYGAWSSLGTLYEEDGNREAARQMKFCALHIEGDAEGWSDLAMEFKAAGMSEECIYCLRKAISKDPQDVMSLWEISAQYKATGKMSKALDAFRKLLRHDPDTAHDFSLLADLYAIILETRQYRFGADALRTAFDWHIQTFSGPGDFIGTEPNTMTLENVINLADLLLQLDELEEVVVIIRRGQRWLQGRRDQKHWDVFDDDREYDAEGVERGEDETRVPSEEEQTESFPLDTNLRQRLAMVRLKLGNDVDAKIHVDELLRLEPEPYKDMFVELGNALMGREQWDKALECFVKLQESENVDDDPETILSVGICHHRLKDNGPALEALRWVVGVQPDNLDARLKLANVLEDSGQKAEALEIVSEVLRIRAQEAAGTRGRGANAADKDKPKQTKADKAASQKLNKRILEGQMREKMQRFWEEVQAAEAEIEEGVEGAFDRFIFAAGTMIENFRMAKVNFPKNRGVSRIDKSTLSTRKDVAAKAQEMQDRLERTLGFEDEGGQNEEAEEEEEERYIVVRHQQFYGLGCEEWLTLIVKYCCVLMVKNEEQLALEHLEHVIWAGLFNNRRAEIALRMTIIACAMRTKSYSTIVDNCRRLGQISQFRTEPYMLMLGCMGGGGVQAHNAWQNHILQKFIHRELRQYDSLVKGYKFHFSASARRWAQELKVGMTDRLGDEMIVEDDDEDEEEVDEDEDGDEGGKGKKGKGKKGKKVEVWKRGKKIMLDPEAGRSASRDVEDDFGSEMGGRDDREDTPDDGIDPAFSDIPIRPTKFSPLWNFLYGMWMLNGKSYQTALFYFLRAYEHDQYHPLLCLCLAQAYFGRAIVRQADNRNYFVAQGAAFLDRYRKLCDTTDPLVAEEVEYNFARAFHSIGVSHLAVRHYEKVLTLVEGRMDECEDDEDREAIRTSSMVYEAAHNLMLIYGTNGSMALVKEKSKWLAI